MAKQTTSATKSPSTGEDLGRIVDSNDRNVSAFMKSNEAAVSGMAAINHELMTFATRRLSENLQQSDSLMHCKDAEEAFRLNCDFAQAATRQYLEEATRLLSLANRVSQDCWAPFEARTKEALHEFNGND